MKNALAWGLMGAGALGVLLGLQGRATAAPLGPICQGSPPSPQPPVPPGWTPHRGSVTDAAMGAATAALSMPMGASTTFFDEDGVERGLLLMWHCHEPGEGTPVGWHKGATLFEVS